jgi:hypothetical protein
MYITDSGILSFDLKNLRAFLYIKDPVCTCFLWASFELYILKLDRNVLQFIAKAIWQLILPYIFYSESEIVWMIVATEIKC